MTNAMTGGEARLWWAQIKAVIRLEMKKTFFAKRGLWIYLVAALPVFLFIAFAVATSGRQHQSASVARRGEKMLTYQDLLAVKPGMTREEVVAILGKPPVNFHWAENRPLGPGVTANVLRENYHYSDGQNDLFVGLLDGKVESVDIQNGPNRGQDSIMFAGVFQFFLLRMPRNFHEFVSRRNS
jgi:hypothetical protein